VDTAQSLGGISLVRAGGDGLLGTLDDVNVTPQVFGGSGYMGRDDDPNLNHVILRFAETLPDDTYQLSINGKLASENSGLLLNGGKSVVFRLDLGAQVVSVVPQPITRQAGSLTQARDKVIVYFNANDPLDKSSAETVSHYRLVETNPLTGQDVAVRQPQSVSYETVDASGNKTSRAILTFDSDLGDKLYRLQIGGGVETPPEVVLPVSDENSSFATATGLGVLGVGGKTLTASINVRPSVPTALGPLLFPTQPGTVDEPGHRELPIALETHAMPAASLTNAAAAGLIAYNFQINYGVDGQGNPLVNAITETQKQRAREIFEYYSLRTGIRVVETENSGFTIVTGDIRAVEPTLPVPNGPAGICGNGLVVMNGSLNWGESEYGGAWHDVATHEIGHALGLGHSYDLPSNMGSEAPVEGVIPGEYDLVHLSVLRPKNGSDVDLYSFTLGENGRVSLETVVARPGQVITSFADTVLALYREDPATGKRELVSRNDDYYGRDSFIGIDLQATNGTQPYTYYVAVTSTGTTFDPNVENSGDGGRSDGAYRLRIGFMPASAALNTIVEPGPTPLTALDGDRDGVAGGSFNFWFQSSTAANTIYVDKVASSRTAAITNGLFSATGVNTSGLTVGMVVKGTGIAANTTITAIDVVAGSITLSQRAVATNVAVSLTFSDGSTSFPFIEIDDAISAVADKGSTKVIRILGNAGGTPYLLGTTLAGQPLPDGAEFVVPENVTVMIDEGAVFKLRAQVIDVGSSTPLVSRSGAALQVLGTPDNQVRFTSYHDDDIGSVDDGVGPDPSGGQWGGIVLRGDSDSPTKRVFLNSISQAVLKYGGGQVRVNGQLQSFAPIHLETTRPTLVFNTIQNSAGAAISADPNSFEETPGRRGPELRGNSLTDNAINGLFVRVRTQFGQPIDTLDVPAVFAARDITYVLTENLLINGGVGGYLDTTVAAVGDLTTGSAAITGMAGTADLAVGMQVAGGGVPAGTTIVAVDSATQVTLSAPVTQTSANVSLTFTGIRPRDTGRLTVDPGVVVKLQGSRIELGRGNAQLVAEGDSLNRVIFTSAADNRFGAGGTFDVFGTQLNQPAAGDWGGIIVNAVAQASIDNAYIAYGGGQTSIEGGFDRFNVIEVHQGRLRLANSRIENNADGASATARAGRGTNAAATIFVRGAQPVIVGNDFRSNAGAAVSINVNALTDAQMPDPGRATGAISRFTQYDDNSGPLVAGNQFSYPAVPVYDPTEGIDPRNANLIVNGSFENILTLPQPLGFTTSYAFDASDLQRDRRWSVVESAADVHPLWADYAARDGLRYFVANGSPSTTDVVWQMAGSGRVRGGLEYQFEAYVASSHSAAPARLSFQYSTDSGLTWQTLAVAGLTAADGVGNWKGVYARWTPAMDGDVTVRLVNANAEVLGNDFGLDSLFFGPAYLGAVDPPPKPFPNYPSIAGMVVRGGEVTVEGVWDDTDVVHVVTSEIVVDNFHSATGLRLMSDPSASLVVKLLGEDAGFTATGHGTDIDDRIGGTVQILGQPGYPVVLTSLKDDSVGSGTNPLGLVVKDTNGDGASSGSAADWRGLKFLPYSNDRNVSVMREAERTYTGGVEANGVTVTAQYLGVIAPSGKGGDDNRRLGFEVHGFISGDDTTDVDVYSFDAYAGSEVWIDVDKTSASLDAMVELLDASGRVLARSADSQRDAEIRLPDDTGPIGIGEALEKNPALGLDFYSQNPRDPGMRVVLPGTAGGLTQYFVRVRSQPRVVPTATKAVFEATISDETRVQQGATSGRYELRLRLQQRDEKPGSTVRYADIRYPVIGIDVQGLPQNSPLVGENAEAGANETLATAQTLGNLLATDRNTISVAGALASASDVDWYALDLAYEDIQVIGGVSGGSKTWSTVFDIDYADGFRGDLTISVFNAAGQLLYVGRDSNVDADQPTSGAGNGFNDLSKGSAGRLDPFIGPAQMPAGIPGTPQRYYVAISSNELLPAVLDATFRSAATNSLVRLEPITSAVRVVEDHIGFTGYHSGELYSGADALDYTLIPPSSGPMFDLPNLIDQVGEFTFDQVQLYVSERPAAGFPAISGINADDLAMRSDGWLYSYVGVAGAANTAGELSRTGIVSGGGVIGRDNIPNSQPLVPFQEQNLAPTNTATVVNTTNFGLSTINVTALTPLDRVTLTGVLQYSATLTAGQPAVTGTWSFTTAANGALTFTAVGVVPAGLQEPVSGTVTAQGQIAITWSSNVTITQTGLLSNPTLASVSYQTIPDVNAVTTDRVDALAWHRRTGTVGGAVLFDQLLYSVRDVTNAGAATGVSRLYLANITTGDASTGRVGDVIQTAGGALGLTTGMAFRGDTLYGVDDRGHLFTIDRTTAVATMIRTVSAGTSFQGLAFGPQNVAGGPSDTPGYFADKLFAIDKNGWVYCFDTSGNLLPVFNGDFRQYNGHTDDVGLPVDGNFTGLAFSPLDVNLWRATNVRGGDAGHGVMVTVDHTRDAAFNDNGDRPPESQGGTSIYYGFDNSGGGAVDGTALGHVGVVSPTWASDLASGIGTSVANLPSRGGVVALTGSTLAGSTAVIVTSTLALLPGMAVTGVGIPRGATIESVDGLTQVTISAPATSTNDDIALKFKGDGQSITTLPFSLADATYTDKPTLYFNYFLGSGAGSTEVEVSADGGEWVTVATNDHARSQLDLANAVLPAFPSVSSRISQQPNQIVQELFEGTGWRQARIDLGEFAGATDVLLRFKFAPTADASGRCEGAYFDDIMVGFAERGEVVTGAQANGTNFFTIGTPESFTTPRQNLEGPYQLEIRRGPEFGDLTNPNSGAVQLQPANLIDTNDVIVRGVASQGTGPNITPGAQYRGDDNTPRDQGQFIIESNFILEAADYGIRIDAAARDAGTNAPLPGAVRNVPVLNNNRLVPGVVVVNNVVSTSGTAGILFSGDHNAGAGATAPVPFGRIVNNTIYGGSVAQGVGVDVRDNAGPTLLNNLFANLGKGVAVDASSAANQRTVVGTSAFYNTAVQVDGVASDRPITLTGNPFVNADRGNFYLVNGSAAIDSSVDVLQERTDYAAVISPLGIPVSPIIAPARDLYGQLRSDDPSQASAPGLGSAVFKDRGAVDRVDFTQPRASLVDPLDQSTVEPIDLDTAENVVRPRVGDFTRFVIQLEDIGVGIDRTTVVGDAFRLTRNGTRLVEGTHFLFRYLETTNQVVLESASEAVFPRGVYTLSIGTPAGVGGPPAWVTDLANNTLLPNQADGTISYRIELYDKPAAPTGVTGIAGDRQVTVTWLPGSSGGLEITDYVVQYKSSSDTSWTTFADGTSTATSATVTGLVNGTSYLFQVAAVNAAGEGAYGQSAPVTPQVPAPTSVAGIAGNGQVTVSWMAPVVAGGTVLTDYVIDYSSNGGSSWTRFADGTSTTTSATVTGLVNGTAYVFRVAAVTAGGTGAYGQSAPVTPLVPAPAGVVGVPGNRQVALTWTAPVDANGAPIVDYVVQYTTYGGTSWTTFADGTSTATAATVTGLTNGTSYLFRVAAVTAGGTGAFGQSAPVTPRTVAGAPTSVSGVAGNAQVVVSWVAPVSNGGAPITDYVVQYSSNGGTSWDTFADATSTATSATVTGLTNGMAYLFRVAAVNAAGSGAYGQTSATVTPKTVASAPVSVVGTPGNGLVSLTWTAPSNGGAAITDYVVQYSSNSGTSWTTFADGTSSVTSATVTGLTNGTAYLFRVAAVNAAGTGAYGQSAAVTPRTVATAPRNLVGSPRNGQAVLTWTAPLSNGGAAITDYAVQYSSNSGTSWTTFADGLSTGTTATVTGLTNGTNYVFRVAAINAAGTGAFAQSTAIRPYVPVSAPTGLAAVAGNTQVTLTWTAPNSTPPVTDYRVQYRVDAVGSAWQTFADGLSTTPRAVVTGLTNGSRYFFRVAAITSEGIGFYTNGTLAATPSAPPVSAPSAVQGSGRSGVITLRWNAASSTLQAPVTGYVIQYLANTTNARWVTLSLPVGNVTTATISSLTSRLGYRFRVAARNASGIGPWSAASAIIRPY
jgi:hypothetical protein